MCWFKFALDYVDVIFEEKEKQLHTNSKDQHESENTEDPEGPVLENQINSARKNIIENPKLKNESRQPNNYFSHGQGGDYRMQEGRDQPWNQSPDNFTTPTPWNTQTR